MKKLLSLLLALSLLLCLAGCAAADSRQLQAQETIQTGGTTEPLFWPPLPTETEETTTAADETHSQEEVQPSQQDQTPVQPQTPDSGKGDSQEATYYPREDETPRPTLGVENESTQQDQPAPDNRPQATESQPAQSEETSPPETAPTQPPAETSGKLDPNGFYDSKEDVALFIRTYRRLPDNYYTKDQAESLFGWEGGALSKYKAYACIGGDRFYNNKGLLSGYTYYECDIDTIGMAARGAKRLVFAYNGPIYYTDDHYESFTMLYGAP